MLTEALDQAGRVPVLLRRLAELHLQRGAYDAAHATVAELLAAEPEDPGALDILARIHLRQDNLEEAEAAATRLVALTPPNANRLRALAASLPGKATCRAVESNPKDSNSLGLLAAQQLRQGDVEAAAAANAKVLELVPGNPVAQRRMGEISIRQGDPDQAETWFRQAISATVASGSADLSAFRQLSGLFLNMGDLDQAKAVLREALAYLPDADVMCRLAQIEERKQDWDAAADWLSQAIELSPSLLRPYNILTGIRLRQKDLDGAARALRIAATIAPEDGTVIRNQRNLERQRKQASGA